MVRTFSRNILFSLLAVACLSALQQDNTPALRFGVIGDSGTGGEAQKRIAQQMYEFHLQNPWEFVLMLGDNIYPDGHPKYFDSKFKDVYKNLMESGVQFHAALGNHDLDHPAARRGMVQIRDPAFGYVGKKPEYTFSAGPILKNKERLARFICLNSEAWLHAINRDRPEDLKRRLSRLRNWLEKSSSYRWNILYLHHPLYSYVTAMNFWGLFGHGSYENLRETLEPELIGHVDVVFAGHDHFYQKIKPQSGVHYFVSGAAGKLLKTGGKKNHPDVEFAAKDFHFMDVLLRPDSLRYQAISDEGEVIHAGTISNPGPNKISFLQRLRRPEGPAISLDLLRKSPLASPVRGDRVQPVTNQPGSR